MAIDLTKIVEAVIGLAVALVARYLVPWIRMRMTAGQQEILETVLRVGVMSAEQMFGAGRGAEKLEAVKKYLQAKGFDVDVEQIEAAVWAYINADKMEIDEG